MTMTIAVRGSLFPSALLLLSAGHAWAVPAENVVLRAMDKITARLHRDRSGR